MSSQLSLFLNSPCRNRWYPLFMMKGIVKRFLDHTQAAIQLWKFCWVVAVIFVGLGVFAFLDRDKAMKEVEKMNALIGGLK